jgi:oxygen-independent coproporphyrinogen-3 oxidase
MHVPWIKPGQRRFAKTDLPGEAKRALYERIASEAEGYREIGLDHFARDRRPERRAVAHCIAISWLHRGLYATAVGSWRFGIGDAGDAFAQNEKDLQQYHRMAAELPIQRGHLLDEEDRVLRHHILQVAKLATAGKTPYTGYLDEVPGRLTEFAADGLCS